MAEAEGKKEKQNATYVRVEYIAQIFGVSVRRVQQLTQEGIINTDTVEEDGRKQKRYDLIPTIMKYIRFLSEKAHGKAHRTDKEIELREKKMEADLALKESQGELHRLKTQIMDGSYISLEEVKLDYARFFVTFKKFATSLPARIAGMLSGSLDPVESRRIEKELAGEVNALLGSFVIAGCVEPKDAKKILREEEQRSNEDPKVGEEVQSN